MSYLLWASPGNSSSAPLICLRSSESICSEACHGLCALCTEFGFTFSNSQPQFLVDVLVHTVDSIVGQCLSQLSPKCCSSKMPYSSSCYTLVQEECVHNEDTIATFVSGRKDSRSKWSCMYYTIFFMQFCHRLLYIPTSAVHFHRCYSYITACKN